MIKVKSVIDHLGIITKDLSVLENIFYPLGFSSGKKVQMDTGLAGEKAPTNMHFMFDNVYLECIQSSEGDYLREYLNSECALHTVVISSDDVDKSYENAKKFGYDVSNVMTATRPADHGENKGTAIFDWIKILNSDIKNTLLGIAYHKTKSLIYQENRYMHSNTAYELTELFVCVNDESEQEIVKQKLENQYNAFKDCCDTEHLINDICIVTKEELVDLYKFSADIQRSNYHGFTLKCRELNTIEKLATENNFKLLKIENGLVLDFSKEMNLFIKFVI